MYRKIWAYFHRVIAFSAIIKNSGIQVDKFFINICLVVNSVRWTYVIPAFKTTFVKTSYTRNFIDWRSVSMMFIDAKVTLCASIFVLILHNFNPPLLYGSFIISMLVFFSLNYFSDFFVDIINLQL